MARVISLGEILWDVFADGERLGGAPFNFAAHSAQAGQEVIFVGAVGLDERGTRALAEAERLGLRAGFIARIAELPTGYVTVTVDARGEPDYVIHRPVAYDAVKLSQPQLRDLAAFSPQWVYFGTLQMISPAARQALRQVLDACPAARRFYDINLRKDSYTPELLRDLLGLADVLKVNEEELRVLARELHLSGESIANVCRALTSEYSLEIVCVTCGERGCVAWGGGGLVEVPGHEVEVVDAVGAGDAFAAGFVLGLSQGRPLREVCDLANRLGALVAGRPGAVPRWSPEELAFFGARQ